MQKDLYFDGDPKKKIFSWKKELSPFSSRWKKLDIDRSALLVIDMQSYFLDEKSHAFVPTGKAVLSNVQNLISHFRDHSRPVIFTRFAVEDGEDDPISNWWADTVSEGSEASRLAEEIKTEKSDKVIRKSRYSSFYETDLEEHLKVQDVSDLVITGVLTNLCCETAAREAFDRGFNVFSVMDGMATYSEEVHIASLKNLAYGFSTPLCTEDILS